MADSLAHDRDGQCVRGARRATRPLLVMLAAGAMLVGCGSGTDTDALIDKAEAHREAGEVGAAIIELKNALQADPDLLEARWMLGKLYLELGDGKSANKEFERVAELGRRDDEQAMALSSARLLEGRYRDVLGFLSTVEIDADPALVVTMRGEARFGLRETRAAEAAFRRALEIDPEQARAMRGMARVHVVRGELEEAEALTRRSLELEPKSTQTWLLKARIDLSRERYESALEAFRAAQALVRGAPEIRVGIVNALFGMKRVEEARKELDELYVAAPLMPQVNYLRAADAHVQGDAATARAALREVLQVDPNHALGLRLSGVLHFAAAEWSQAEDGLARALRRIPQDVDLRKLLASARIKLGDGERAAEALLPVLESAADDPQVLGLLGSAYLMQSQYAEGVELLERAAAIAPDEAVVRTQLGVSYLAAGSTELAQAALSAAVELDPTFSRAGVVLVYTLLRDGKWDEAIAGAVRLSEARPDDPLPLDLLGAANRGKGDLEEARRNYRAALEKNPDFVNASLSLASIAQSEGDLAEAARIYRGLVEKDPRQVTAATQLARLLLVEGDVDVARSLLEAARNESELAVQARLTLSELYLAEGRFQDAIAVAEEAMRAAQGAPEPVLALGRIYVLRRDYERAVQVFRDGARRFPESLRLLFELGIAQKSLGRLRAATDQFEAILAKDATFTPATLSLGDIAIAEGQPEIALQRADEVLARVPDEPAAHLLRGDAFMSMGAPDKAISAYDKSLAQSPVSLVVLRKYQATVAHLGRDEGRRVLQDWIESHPDDVDIWRTIAEMELRFGTAESAISAYQRVIELNPSDAVGLNNLALLLHGAGRTDEALPHARAAYRKVPNNPSIADTMGWLLVETGDVEQGLSILEQAASRAPAMVSLQFHLALALERTGDVERARRLATTVTRVAAANPHKQAAAELLERLK